MKSSVDGSMEVNDLTASEHQDGVNVLRDMGLYGLDCPSL